MPSTAPVCRITPQKPYAPPPQAMATSIPIASDLASAIQAVNALRQLLQILMNQIPNNNIPPPGGFTSQPTKNANFNEVSRVTTPTKIVDPTNPANYVIVNQITALKFLDKASGQTWVWKQ